jgi:hypothetical protein
MKTLEKFLSRYYHKMGFAGVLFPMLPIVVLVWLIAKEPFISVFNVAVPSYIFSGRIFSERFDIIHAGSALDQPTIGKWLFWFSVMALLSLPYINIIRRFSNTKQRAVRITICIFSSIICLLLLCILSWPITWLIQYIHSMGFTYRRVFGLICAITGGVVVIRFMYKTIKTT